jgi:hypothetical protein
MAKFSGGKSKKSKRKRCFFEKKQQKTFIHLPPGEVGRAGIKSFWPRDGFYTRGTSNTKGQPCEGPAF